MAHEPKGSTRYGYRVAGCFAAAIVGALAVGAVRRRHDRDLQTDGWDDRPSHGPAVPVHRRQRPRSDRRTGERGGVGVVAVVIHAAAVCGVLCRLVLADWWDPGSWWSSLAGDVSSAAGEVKRLVRQGVDAAVRQVERVIDSAIDAVERTFDTIRSDASAAWGWINSIRGDIIHIWSVDIPNAWHHALDVAAGWVHNVEHALDSLRHDAAHWFDIVRHEAATALDAVVRDLVDPVIRWVERAEHWIQAHFASWWDEIYRHVINPILKDLRTALHYAEALWDWYWHQAKDMIEICIKAEKWLVWFAEHPFTALEDAGRMLVNEFSIKSIERDFHEVETHVDQWAEDFGKLLS